MTSHRTKTLALVLAAALLAPRWCLAGRPLVEPGDSAAQPRPRAAPLSLSPLSLAPLPAAAAAGLAPLREFIGAGFAGVATSPQTHQAGAVAQALGLARGLVDSHDDPAGAAPVLGSVFDYDPGSRQLLVSGEPAPFLSNGRFKRVFIHPEHPGWVVKVYDNPLLGRFRGIVGLSGVFEDGHTRQLAHSGSGPRWLGAGRMANGYRFQIVERVSGLTVGELMRRGQMDPSTASKVDALLERLSRERRFVNDLHADNVMIGTTDSDPAEKAYVVDAPFIWPSRALATTLDWALNKLAQAFDQVRWLVWRIEPPAHDMSLFRRAKSPRN